MVKTNFQIWLPPPPFEEFNANLADHPSFDINMDG